MLFNLVILLALAGTVRTSVIIEVYEDGEVKMSHSLRGGCNFRACDQLCRRLGFNSGTCVGDKCNCDNFAPLKEDKAGYSLHGGCNDSDCDQLCRRLGFKSGICVGDRCTCGNFAPLKKDKAVFSLHGECNDLACDQLCRRLGFKGGICVEDKCNCGNFAPLKKIIYNNSPSTSCTDSICDQLCQRLGFKSGACVAHRCQCDSLTGEAVDYLLKTTEENKASYFIDDCNFQACDQLCRNLGFPGGACVGDRCDCDNFKEVKESKHSKQFITEEDTDENNNEENHVRSSKEQPEAAMLPGFCDIIKCNDMCHRLNYIGGTCRNGSCQCF